LAAGGVSDCGNRRRRGGRTDRDLCAVGAVPDHRLRAEDDILLLAVVADRALDVHTRRDARGCGGYRLRTGPAPCPTARDPTRAVRYASGLRSKLNLGFESVPHRVFG